MKHVSKHIIEKNPVKS